MKVAINGFGRIGKLVFRALLEKNPKDINIVAINELGSVESSAHLLKYDSVHGILKDEISSIKNGLKIGKHKINFYSFTFIQTNITIVIFKNIIRSEMTNLSNFIC